MSGFLQVRYLEKKNKLKYDDLIEFIDEGHIYNVYSEYFNMVLNKFEGGGSLPLRSVTETVGIYFNSYYKIDDPIEVWNNVDCRIRMETDENYVYYGCKSPSDIKNRGGKGASLGTRMHNYFEDLANLYAYNKDRPENREYYKYVEKHMSNYSEYQYFKMFCDIFGFDSGKREFFRTEFCMFHPELNISGMIDGIVYNKETQGYEIIDYKRCSGGVKLPKFKKSFDQLADNSKGKVLPSLKQCRNITITKYGIQLSIYRYMFERMYPGKKITGLYLIVVDSRKIPKPSAFEIVEIPLTRHDQHIFEIFQHRATNILEKKSNTLPKELHSELIEFLKPKESDIQKELERQEERDKQMLIDGCEEIIKSLESSMEVEEDENVRKKLSDNLLKEIELKQSLVN